MEKLFAPVRLFFGWKKTIVLLILLITVITPVALYQFGTSYYPLYSFDDHLHQKVNENKNFNANKIRFKTQEVKEDIRKKVAQEKFSETPPAKRVASGSPPEGGMWAWESPSKSV